MSRLLFFFVVLVTGAALSIGTLFIPVDVPNHQALQLVKLGWPLPFIQQDLSSYDPTSWPEKFRINAPQEHATIFHLEFFCIDVFFFSAGIGVVLFWLHRNRK